MLQFYLQKPKAQFFHQGLNQNRHSVHFVTILLVRFFRQSAFTVDTSRYSNFFSHQLPVWFLPSVLETWIKNLQSQRRIWLTIHSFWAMSRVPHCSKVKLVDKKTNCLDLSRFSKSFFFETTGLIYSEKVCFKIFTSVGELANKISLIFILRVESRESASSKKCH